MKSNASPDPDFGSIADRFPQVSDISQPRKSARSSYHRPSIALAPKTRTLARNVCSLWMHPPVIPENTTQVIRRRWRVPFSDLLESQQCLSQTRLGWQLPIHAKSAPWLDSAQIHVLRRTRWPRRPDPQQPRPHRETDAREDLLIAQLPH